MKNTIIGFFDDRNQAEQAKSQLAGFGVSETDVQIFSGNMDKGSMSSQNSSASGDLTFGEKIKNFFKQMGDWKDSNNLGYFAEGMRRGGTTLTVSADEAQNDRISDILTQCGAVDIDSRAQFYKESGFSNYDLNATPLSPDENLSYRQKYSDWEQKRNSKSGSERYLKNDENVRPVTEEKLDTGKRVVQIGRVRVFTHMPENDRMNR